MKRDLKIWVLKILLSDTDYERQSKTARKTRKNSRKGCHMKLTEKDIVSWVRALQGGEYAQGIGALCRHFVTDEKKEVAAFCCLGVACDLFIDGSWERRPHDSYWSIEQAIHGPPEELRDAINAALDHKKMPGSRKTACDALVYLNDDKRSGFFEIGEIIERAIRDDLY